MNINEFIKIFKGIVENNKVEKLVINAKIEFTAKEIRVTSIGTEQVLNANVISLEKFLDEVENFES